MSTATNRSTNPIFRLARQALRVGALGLGVLALTGCEYVYDVIVPWIDTTPPLAAATIYQNGDHHWAENKTWITSNPSQGWYCVSGGFDSGGTKRLTMYGEGFATYTSGSTGTSQTFYQTPIVINSASAGYPGTTVKNGLHTFRFVQPSTFAGYGPGTLVQSGYGWWVKAEDFKGNVSWRNGGTLIYKP